MSNEFVIEQKQGMGTSGTQIGIQNNYGLSANDAVQMAFSIFKEYYPQLRDEALAELNKLVTEKLSSIPQDHIIPPKPRVVVPTLQNASITEEQQLRECYANLLANSMNKTSENIAHPSFVEIIKQLTSDEAKLLNYMYKKERIPTINLDVHKTTGGCVTIVKGYTNMTELCGCDCKENWEEYVDNLVRLGLLRRSGGERLVDKAVYDPLKQHSFIQDIKRRIEANEELNAKVKKVEFAESYIELTSFGKSFCSVCLQSSIVVVAGIKKENI